MQKLYTMKVLVFAALIVAVVGGPIVKTWRLDEMSDALYPGNGDVDPEMKLYVEEAYNKLVSALLTNNLKVIKVIPSPSGLPRWTMKELDAAMKDPNTNPNYLPAISKSYEYLKNTHEIAEEPKNEIEIQFLAMDISTWTLSDLTEAIANPETNPGLLPYLETARTKLTSDPEFRNKTKITIVTNIGLVKPDANAKSTTTSTETTTSAESIPSTESTTSQLHNFTTSTTTKV